LTAPPATAGRVFRNIVAALVLIPLAIVIIAFAVANRQAVTVSLDPFSAEHLAASVTLPLFALIIAVLIVGVVIGGMAGWLRHGRWRRTARRLERDIARLRGEIDAHKRAAGAASAAGAPVAAPEPLKPPDRLRLRAPVR